MSQPVKLSDALVLDARLTAEVANRSIAGQIEHWALLGRAIEGVLRSDRVLELKRRGKARPLSALLESVDSAEGRERVAKVIAARPFPHFEASPESAGAVVRVDEDGTRTVGRFVNRVFQPRSK